MICSTASCWFLRFRMTLKTTGLTRKMPQMHKMANRPRSTPMRNLSAGLLSTSATGASEDAAVDGEAIQWHRRRERRGQDVRIGCKCAPTGCRRALRATPYAQRVVEAYPCGQGEAASLKSLTTHWNRRSGNMVSEISKMLLYTFSNVKCCLAPVPIYE